MGRIITCKQCGATTPSPCQFCGWVSPEEQQRQLDEQAHSIRNWDTPRFYVRRGAMAAGPYTARQIQALAASGDHYSEISDNGAPYVRIMFSPFAQYVPPPKGTDWRPILFVGVGLFALAVGAFGCMSCVAAMGSM